MDAAALQKAQYYVFVTQVYFCALYAINVWDWIITIPREYRFIWKTSWTPIKVAYLFCRYWVLAAMPYVLMCFVGNYHTVDECLKIYRSPVALAMWNQVGSEIVLLIRTYAFFNKSPFILTGLVACLLTVIAYQLYVDISQMAVLPFVTAPFTQGPCLPMAKGTSKQIIGFFIAPFCFDTLVTLMTIGRAFSIRRTGRGVAGQSRLVQTFLTEGVFYYILISAANLINGIFYLQPDQTISAINVPLSVMMSPLLASRLILDLRERAARLTTARSAFGTNAVELTYSPNGSGGTQSPPPSKKSGFGFPFGGVRNSARSPITSDLTSSFAIGSQGTGMSGGVGGPKRGYNNALGLNSAVTQTGGLGTIILTEDKETPYDDPPEMPVDQRSQAVHGATPEDAEMGFGGHHGGARRSRNGKTGGQAGQPAGVAGIRIDVEQTSI